MDDTGDTPQVPSSGDQSIPKYRLDEEIAKRKALEEQSKFWQTTAMQLQQGGRPQQQNGMSQQEQERLRRLKEENPEAFKAEVRAMRLQQEVGQVKQATASLYDDMDRQKLVARYGKSAEKQLAEIEQVVEAFRANGNYGVTREQAYLWKLGQDKVREDMARANVPQTPAPQETVQDEDFPSGDASFASTLRAGKAASGASNKSLVEIEKDLENIEF